VKHRARGKVPEKIKMPKGVKAAVSDKPGETTEINFYRVKAPELDGGIAIVDLPGCVREGRGGERAKQRAKRVQRAKREQRARGERKEGAAG
jgi:hypothetical protein